MATLSKERMATIDTMTQAQATRAQKSLSRELATDPQDRDYIKQELKRIAQRIKSFN